MSYNLWEMRIEDPLPLKLAHVRREPKYPKEF